MLYYLHLHHLHRWSLEANTNWLVGLEEKNLFELLELPHLGHRDFHQGRNYVIFQLPNYLLDRSGFALQESRIEGWAA
jgi:hypothetical protein